jgi:hypothetical protein
VWSNALVDTLSGQGPEADELDLGLRDVADQDVSATDRNRFGEQDRVDDVQRRSKVQ